LQTQKKNLNESLKPKPQNKNLEKKLYNNEKNNLPNLLWSLAFECFMFPHLHTQEGGRGSTSYNSRAKASDE